MVDLFYLQSKYDINADEVQDKDNADAGEGFVCMALTKDLFEGQYDKEEILLCTGVLNDIRTAPSIFPNTFNGIINDSCSCPYFYDNVISNTHMFHHTNLVKSIEYYDTLWCKF